MNSISTRLSRTWGRCILLAAAVALSACQTVRVISPYDEDTDKQLTVLQQSVDSFITKMLAATPKWDPEARSNETAYSAQKKFYAEFDEKLRALEFRVNSVPKNGKTQALVANIRTVVFMTPQEERLCEETYKDNGIPEEKAGDIASLQGMHCFVPTKTKGFKRITLVINQRNISQVIGAALALEIAKKQGTESN